MTAPSDALPARLECERLVVRPYAVDDAATYLALCLRNKAHLLPYEEGNPALGVTTHAEAEVLLRAFSADWTARRAFFLGAWARDTGELVAQVYVGVVSWTLPELEIGYFVDVDHEGRGLATEAVGAALVYAFEHLGAQRVRLYCDETNARSWRLAERCGFVREGHLRQTQRRARLADGTWGGDYVYGLLREEYLRRRS